MVLEKELFHTMHRYTTHEYFALVIFELRCLKTPLSFFTLLSFDDLAALKFVTLLRYEI